MHGGALHDFTVLHTERRGFLRLRGNDRGRFIGSLPSPFPTNQGERIKRLGLIGHGVSLPFRGVA
jgi:hypothetical protein